VDLEVLTCFIFMLVSDQLFNIIEDF